MMFILLMCCWLGLLVFCWKSLPPYTSGTLSCGFLVVSLFGFDIRVTLNSKMSLGVFYPLWVLEKLRGFILFLFQMFGGIHQWNHLVLNISLLEGFWLLIQCLYSLLACLDFLFLHCPVLVDCMFLGMYPLLQSLMILCISMALFIMFPLSFLILFIWIFFLLV